MCSRDDNLCEIEACSSVFGEEKVQITDNGATLRCRIVIDLEPFEKPVTLRCTHAGVSKSSSVQVLSPVTLSFALPDEYPNVSPEIEMEAIWMSEQTSHLLKEKLAEICSENLGMPVLFFCCQTVIDEVKNQENELSTVCLDDTPYAVKKNLSGFDLLQMMTSSNEESAEKTFENGCYDCEVCFENKMGRYCVRFTPCNHVFCKECVRGYYVSMSRDQVRQMGCLSDACSSTASQQAVKEALGDVEYERYERILLERALGNMSDVVTCARKSCLKPVVVDAQNINLGRCSNCDYVFCVLCKTAYHGVNPCKFRVEDRQKLMKEYENGTPDELALLARRFGGMAQLRRVMENMLNETWIDGNAKPCPKCRAAIQKIDGCNKMHCTKCDTLFCWLCNRIVDKTNPYSHFNGGIGECANRLFEGVEREDFFDDWVAFADILEDEEDDEGEDSDDGHDDLDLDDSDDDEVEVGNVVVDPQRIHGRWR